MRTDNFYPMSDTKMDIAAYTYSYHMPGGSNKDTCPIWKNIKICQLFLMHHSVIMNGNIVIHVSRMYVNGGLVLIFYCC